jgi:hypothetical protein
MHPALAVLMMMNNYFHDVAITVPLASGIVMWTIVRHYLKRGDAAACTFLPPIHRRMRVVVTVSLVWIAVSAIPRILTFNKFELLNATEKTQVTGLIIRHALAFTVIVFGALLWIYLNRRIKAISANSAKGAEY